MEDVERAYVHVDYARRAVEEHKVGAAISPIAMPAHPGHLLNTQACCCRSAPQVVARLTIGRYQEVNVDYCYMPQVERNLKLGEKDVMKPLASMDSAELVTPQ